MSDPSETIASFAQLFTYIDMCKRYIGARIYHPCSPRSRPAELPPAFLAPPITARSVRAWTPPSHWVGKLTRADYLGQVPDIFLADCALLKTAERVSAMKTGGRGLDEKAELRIVLERLEIRKTARFRFLEGLVCLGVCLEDVSPRSRSFSASPHSWLIDDPPCRRCNSTRSLLMHTGLLVDSTHPSRSFLTGLTSLSAQQLSTRLGRASWPKRALDGKS